MYICTSVSPFISQIQKIFKLHPTAYCQIAKQAVYKFRKPFKMTNAISGDLNTQSCSIICHKVLKKSDYISRKFQWFYYFIYSFGERGGDICIPDNPLSGREAGNLWMALHNNYMHLAAASIRLSVMRKDSVSEDASIGKWRVPNMSSPFRIHYICFPCYFWPNFCSKRSLFQMVQ